jgi:hypothetical protein
MYLHAIGGSNVRLVERETTGPESEIRQLEESVAATGVSLATAKRELRLARAWLALKGEPLA